MTNGAMLRLPDVQHLTGLSRSTIYLRIQQGSFPRQIKLGARAVGWLGSEIQDWIELRIANRESEAAATTPAAFTGSSS